MSQETKMSLKRQKGESQNGGNKKTNPAKFSGKWICLTPDFFSLLRYSDPPKILQIDSIRFISFQPSHKGP